VKRSTEDCLVRNGVDISRLLDFVQVEIPALIHGLISTSVESQLLVADVFAHNDLHSGNIIRVDGGSSSPVVSYQFIDSENAKVTKVPWSDIAHLDIHTRVAIPILKGRDMLRYVPRGLHAFAKAYLQERGRKADEESVRNFVFIVQAFGLPHMIYMGTDFAFNNEEGTNLPMCQMLGRMLSPAGLDCAAAVLHRAAAEPEAAQRVADEGFWAVWMACITA
jgi:hypothetical protein